MAVAEGQVADSSALYHKNTYPVAKAALDQIEQKGVVVLVVRAWWAVYEVFWLPGQVLMLIDLALSSLSPLVSD